MSNPIKEFFKRKKMEHTFKKAGSGHQMAESADNTRTTGESSSSQSERMADAALKRLNKTNKHETLENIMQSERKKILAEYKAQQTVDTVAESTPHDDNRYVEFDNKQLFNCPIIGLNQSLPIDDLILEIQNYIDKNYSQDLILKSAMSIKTCNFNIVNDITPKITQCVSTLTIILTNLAVDKNKFGRIRKSKIETKVLDLFGAEEFLLAIGFELDPTGEWFVFNSNDEDLTEQINYYIDVLNSTQNFPIILDRQVIIDPQQQTDEETLSDDFYNLTADDLLRQQKELTEKKDTEEPLQTQAMREKQKMKKVKCNFCRLRFKLPSGTTIDATFSTNETLQDVKTWLLLNYDTKSQISIKCGTDVFTDQHDSKTLYDLNLIPAAALFVCNKSN